MTDVIQRSDGTINRRLHDIIDLSVKASDKPIGGVKTSDITVDAARNLWFRLYTPTDTVAAAGAAGLTLPVIIFFHGGGFAFFSAGSIFYHNLCCRLACKIPAVVISVNYRLSPEHRFPSQYDDGLDTLKFLDEAKLSDFPADLSRCFLAGDSAGANLAHHVACRIGEAELRRLRVIGQISVQPFLGGEERTASENRLTKAALVTIPRTDWVWKAFLPEGENRDHEAVNVMGPRAVDLRGVKYPKTMVVVGGFDPLQDRQRQFREWLRRSGKEVELIEYSNAVHAFYFFPELPESSELMDENLQIEGGTYDGSIYFANDMHLTALFAVHLSSTMEPNLQLL
ncbi:hypothetical protein NE237_018265 [Protea cynaroides]|uniref:Alpha/beta hydrolase fold-3 domain-containing protein n=1 Tax=Protea cynaroides TaxID=273540 RepID=A0A9Q0K9J7_9MAGN|nr:hypothetical protein NE237_018265 [Protea cynaroides]